MTPSGDDPQPESHRDVDPGLIRLGGISYLHIPAADVRAAAALTFRDPAGNMLGLWHDGPR